MNMDYCILESSSGKKKKINIPADSLAISISSSLYSPREILTKPTSDDDDENPLKSKIHNSHMV